MKDLKSELLINSNVELYFEIIFLNKSPLKRESIFWNRDLKDFSLALGQIERVPLILSIWAPIIALSLVTFVGVIQINEK